MEETEILHNIIPHLKRKGYTKVSIRPILPHLKWSFDIFAESSEEALALEYRKNDKIQELFIERIKGIKGYKKRLYIYCIFDKRPRESIIALLKQYGIGVMVFQNSELYDLSTSKNFSKGLLPKKKPKKPTKKEKPMYQIWVYPCSKQYELDGKTICKERTLICRVINRLKRKQVSIDYLLVEDDLRDDRKFKRKILRNLNKCHIFIGVINERYSPYIRYEIYNSFKSIRDKLRIIILKKNMLVEDIDEKEKQMRLIKYIESITNHIPYTNLREFEEKLEINLWRMIDRLYKQNGSKPPYVF